MADNTGLASDKQPDKIIRGQAAINYAALRAPTDGAPAEHTVLCVEDRQVLMNDRLKLMTAARCRTTAATAAVAA